MPVESDDELRSILELDTIAVVGCSTTPGKAAHDIPQFMHERGYDVLPVNPYADEVLGRAAYDSLSDVEESVDIVDVFRPSDEVAGVVDEALENKVDHQSAILEALAEREGVDVDELVTEVAIEEAEPDEATDGSDAAGADENGDAVPEAESDDEGA